MSVSFAQETNGANPNSDPKFVELLRKVEMYLDRDFEEASEQHLLLEIQNDPTSIKLLKEEHSFRTFFKKASSAIRLLRTCSIPSWKKSDIFLPERLWGA